MPTRAPCGPRRSPRLRPALLVLALGLCGAPSAQGQRLFEVPGGQVQGPQFSRDGRYVVCEVVRQHGYLDLRSVCVTDLESRFVLAGVPRSPARAFDPDGWLYVWRSRRIERHPLDGAPAQTVTPFLPGDRSLAGFMLSPDRRSLVYLADADVALQFHLYRVPADGSALPVRLDGGLTLESSPGTPFAAFSPDGSRIAFCALRAGGGLDLHSAPSDGSAPPVLLHGAATGTGGVERSSLQVTTLARVVYLAARSGTGARSLFSVPIDGSAAPSELSVPAVIAAGVPWPPRLGPDGRWVVFHAGDAASSLYSVAADGSAGPRRLDSPSPTSGVQNDQWISADGLRVVFRTTGFPASTLHVAPIDGRTPAVPLTPAGARVRPGFFLSRDLPQRVVYLADPDRAETFELFSQPIDGSAGARALNPSLLPFAFRDVEQLFPSGDGKTALYEANQDQLFLRELYAVRTDGSSAAQRVSRALHGSPDTTGISVSAVAQSGDRVVYVSNHDELDSRELFLSWLLPPRRER